MVKVPGVMMLVAEMVPVTARPAEVAARTLEYDDRHVRVVESTRRGLSAESVELIAAMYGPLGDACPPTIILSCAPDAPKLAVFAIRVPLAFSVVNAPAAGVVAPIGPGAGMMPSFSSATVMLLVATALVSTTANWSLVARFAPVSAVSAEIFVFALGLLQ